MSKLAVIDTDKGCSRVHPGDIVSGTDLDLRGVRVLFINMPLRESAKPNTPPQGPGLMAARLRQFGADATIVDLNAYRIGRENISFDDGTLSDPEAALRLPFGRHLTPREATRLIEAHMQRHGEPDIIALSGMITTLRWQETVARICRALVPDAFIVSGGGLATEIKEGLFGWIPELDAVGHSEGDDIILLMAADVKLAKERNGMRTPSHSIAETHYVDCRARFVYSGDRPRDLEALPFAAWDLLHEDAFGNPLLEWYIATPVWGMAANNSSAAPFTMTRSLTTVSSRGCPYKCAFCYRGAQGERNWGMRSAANLRKEAEWLIESYGIDFLGFPDDNFAVDRRRMLDLPTYLGDLGIRWGTHTRMDEADSRLEPMARSGCIYIGFGAESASKRILYRMDKGGFIVKRNGVERTTTVNGYEFPETMVEAVLNCKTFGVHGNCTWIMGYPGESLGDLQTSVAFILWQEEVATKGIAPGTPEYDAAAASINKRMFTATAYPGTAMFREPKVRDELSLNFGINFDPSGQPIVDDALYRYVLELDDATKVLYGKDGRPLNFGEMPMEQFLEARSYIDSGRIHKILEMR